MASSKYIKINRYDESNIVTSSISPFDDLINLIQGLRSEGFVKEILRDNHGITDRQYLASASKAISLLVLNAIKLYNQSANSDIDVAFLPLYYSMLNLSKIQIILRGKYEELLSNRSHGASYDELGMTKRFFLNEEVRLNRKGSIKLLHKALTGYELSHNRIKLDDVYKLMFDVSAEYRLTTQRQMKIQACNFYYYEQSESEHYIRTTNFKKTRFKSFDPTKTKVIKSPNYWVKENNADNNEEYFWRTPILTGDFDNVKKSLLRYLNRSFMIDRIEKGIGSYDFRTYVDFGGDNKVILPEELLYLLAYFHLSNVVRYNPEHLNRIMNTKYSILILALRQHGFLRYLKLFWSDVVNENYEIVRF